MNYDELIQSLEKDGWTVSDEGHMGLFLLGPDGEHAIIDSYDGGIPENPAEMVGVTVGIYGGENLEILLGSASSETDASNHMILETLDAALENARENQMNNTGGCD